MPRPYIQLHFNLPKLKRQKVKISRLDKRGKFGRAQIKFMGYPVEDR